mmetsp:Transcript_24685/g.38408  ORF Transcript_24685/g.38408 Transcript_24685/m.38408 type:complete len:204 (+) Transcript_24685:580-1191(+)|eukprot:CAMPEP_0170492446 /NCGR_PEP_ID=MMETSP0208-20121228/12249_1 /TAXON_ID=197538 /ORGANISM="Strombidium inclinatum, Strain S3" /LENGTH=203 /DNA_ID=CAMNT_0010768181 /DNA_START=569 /DNA_END=1180 /DNA_ORIENTATION=+
MNELKRLSNEYTLAGQTAAASQIGAIDDQLAGCEDASSIIIDTKTGGGNFILSKEQKEGFMKGQPQTAFLDSEKKVARGNGQIPGEIHQEITNLVFGYVEVGDIENMKKNLAQIGFKNLQDIGQLLDVQQYKQNALFVSCQIADPDKALSMTQFLIEEGKCTASYEDEIGQTCLFYVAREGYLNMVTLFLKYGCNANHVDTYG